jgi:hypothetical protein
LKAAYGDSPGVSFLIEIRPSSLRFHFQPLALSEIQAGRIVLSPFLDMADIPLRSGVAIALPPFLDMRKIR